MIILSLGVHEVLNTLGSSFPRTNKHKDDVLILTCCPPGVSESQVWLLYSLKFLNYESLDDTHINTFYIKTQSTCIIIRNC